MHLNGKVEVHVPHRVDIISDGRGPRSSDDSNMSLLHLDFPKYVLRHLFASTFVCKTVSSTHLGAVAAPTVRMA